MRISVQGIQGHKPVVIDASACVVMAQTDDRGSETVSIAHGDRVALLMLASTLLDVIRQKYGEAAVRRVLSASRVKGSMTSFSEKAIDDDLPEVSRG